MGLAIISCDITLAPATPCEMSRGEEDTMGSTESPLDVQTAQQLSERL